MTDEVVTRLYRCLVEELRQRGHADGQPLKVSELYQELVPYRSVRSALGVELNADYEHALLRLLSGERGLLRLEPEQSREELRREVDAPYPFVGLFRKFSASNVWVEMPPAALPAPAPPPAVSPARVPDPPPPHASGVEGSVPLVAAEAETPPLRAARSGGPAAARLPVQLHREPEAGPVSIPDRTERFSGVGSSCVFCDESLPPGRRVRFCPSCGGDQRLRPCPRCAAVLERDWRFCINCGHEPAGA